MSHAQSVLYPVSSVTAGCVRPALLPPLVANVIVEYREPGAEIWSRVIAAPGETYEEAEASLKARWPTIETRRHVALCPHGVDLWATCELCGRVPDAADKLLGS